MTERMLERIVRESGVPDLLEILAERLPPTDLQSLLLEVYRRRAARRAPAQLLDQYERDRFVRPSASHYRTGLELDLLALSLASPPFEPVELSPVCPLGTNSAVATVDQNVTVATIRNSEVVSDSTNVLALECAVRRRSKRRSTSTAREWVRLCASHRLLRAQDYRRPDLLAHFRLFALCTAGRDEGDFLFELGALVEQLDLYPRFLSAVGEPGHIPREIRVSITDLVEGRLDDRLRSDVVAPLAAKFPNVDLDLDPERTQGRGYYETVCFHVHARDRSGAERLLVDGGFTDWTGRLLSDRKERLLISGIGTERLVGTGRPEGK